ncbi:putative glutaredoxin family protein [Waddlia chondrophila 2032/99]|uniref:Putative glutaredoxin family protein n=2 Tax=Waddlia chondrophila TaxID=71667 RepID=D6YW35_WADCW|nr:glutaredoxin family protein [Waddlia chondrophila]ADI38346.1 putative glutaredoxin family protein [Waddlia chondrophila WSU 86-1044]CCB91429.1 putative glutaredoxin family protein [Waddlia chondrophila 2032/99]
MLKFLNIFFLIFCFATVSAQDFSSKSANPVLYYNPKCPHCKTVMKYLDSQNISVQMKNTSQASYRDELNRMGQRGVPVLVVNGKAIAGSTSIINYLKQHPDIFSKHY